jgi:non-ribosomal peptide synthetase component E (peptide arylation enzyme)
MLITEATKWNIERQIKELDECKKKLEALQSIQSVLGDLPKEILELELQDSSIYYYAGSGADLFLYAPDQPNTKEGKALTLQWIKQTMLLFKNLLDTVWDEKPLCANEKKRTMTYSGEFKYKDWNFSVLLSGCPIGRNCKLIPETHSYTTYNVKCSDNSGLVEV